MSLSAIAKKIVENHKGILAADESTGTIKKRFDAIKVESTETSRRDYRELMFRAPSIEKYIGGVIMYDETIRQKAADGSTLVSVLKSNNISPGIKVDMGAKPLAGTSGETVTEGLDGLRKRLQEYASLGAEFAKWRGVIHISDSQPSDYAIHTNAHALARYSALCQEAGIVPIVEPEVLMDGKHDADTCYKVTDKVLKATFAELKKQNVQLDGILLKPNMVISGSDCSSQASVEEVAKKTLDCLIKNVPSEVPGIVFLSGGQSDILATQHLDSMNKQNKNLPWALSYSYGRALQSAPQKAWVGKKENVDAAQSAFIHRAKCNSLAAAGDYSSSMDA